MGFHLRKLAGQVPCAGGSPISMDPGRIMKGLKSIQCARSPEALGACHCVTEAIKSRALCPSGTGLQHLVGAQPLQSQLFIYVQHTNSTDYIQHIGNTMRQAWTICNQGSNVRLVNESRSFLDQDTSWLCVAARTHTGHRTSETPNLCAFAYMQSPIDPCAALRAPPSPGSGHQALTKRCVLSRALYRKGGEWKSLSGPGRANNEQASI